jgi:formylglycine-generating enzyme required for sulfatase activity
LLGSATLAPAAPATDPEPKVDQEKLLDQFRQPMHYTNSLGTVMAWIPTGFRAARTEVTQGEFSKIMGRNPSKFQGARRPVESVTPTEAAEFCRKLTAAEHAQGLLPKSFAYALPTETEFDVLIANTPLTTAYVSLIGDRPQTTDVASLPPNALGLHDVRGNVWEWCANAVARGGSFQSHEDYLAPSFRFVGTPTMAVEDIGFRVVLKESGGPR